MRSIEGRREEYKGSRGGVLKVSRGGVIKESRG